MALSAAPEIRPLDPLHDRAAFSCGEAALDDYIRQQASQDVRRRVAQVFVASPAAATAIAGYYTLSAASFLREQLPPDLAKRLPRYPIPATLIGRLAVDRAFQGQQLGKFMLYDAFDRILRASQIVGVYATVVDAKNDRARAFYERFGFKGFVEDQRRMFLPLGTIAAALGQ